MIVNFFHTRVPAEATRGFEASWSRRAGLVDTMPGFLGMEVLRDGQEAGHYIVVTRWNSREDFDRWANSPQFVAGHSHTSGAASDAAGSLEFFEIVPSAPTPAQS